MANEAAGWVNATDLQMYFSAARMVAWDAEVATGRVEYLASAGTDRIRRCLDDRALMAAVIDHALRETEHFSVESRMVKPDGDIIWIGHQGKVLRDAAERPIRVIGIAQDITERKEVDEVLRNISVGVSAATSETFFRMLAQHLCLALKADFACIGELRSDETVQTVAMFTEGRFSEGFKYELDGTPCREAIVSGHCSYPQNVQHSFPKDRLLMDMGIVSYIGVALKSSTGQSVGVMSVMNRFPLKNVNTAETILSIFASRAAAELERRRGERALVESEMRNRAILSALPDTVLLLDCCGVIEQCHTKGREELVPGSQLQDVLTPEAAEFILRSCKTPGPDAVAVVEYGSSVSGEARWHEARAVRSDNDKILIVVRDITSRKGAEADLQESRRFSQRIAETSPSVLFVYDVIERRNVYANDRSVDVIGYTPQEITEMGENFITLLMHPDDLALLPALAHEYATRQDGEVFEHVFRFKHKNGKWRWVHRTATIFSRTSDGRPKQILGAVTDITRFKHAELELQELSARLLGAQDEERRRIARELHDTTGQNLAALCLYLEAVQKSGTDLNVKELLSECQRLCKEAENEIRTLSYLLHPPELDLLGLVGALGLYVEGFEKRTGINTRLDVGQNIRRLPRELETDLFRVIQEGLTNILRHSGSTTAAICLEKSDSHLILQIEDSGRGLPDEISQETQRKTGFGVGIPGMRERLRQYGGSLEVRSTGQGTTLRGVVPLPSSAG
jgi:PAS domain S-box-containing protein